MRIEIWKEPIYKRHSSTWNYISFWIQVAFLICCIVFPYGIVYSSRNLWKKNNYYYEQPTVHFNHKFILELQDTSSIFTSVSTLKRYNDVIESSLRRPIQFSSNEIDSDADGRPDVIKLNAMVPLNTNEKVNRLKAVAFFQYSLKDRVKLEMESMGMVQIDTPIGATSLVMYTDMQLRQVQPLSVKNSRTVYNTELLSNVNITSYSDVSIQNLMYQSYQRNETTKLNYDGDGYLWRSQPATSFNLTLYVRINEQRIEYIPGPLEVVVYAWSFFLTFAILFWWFLSYIRNFVFRYQIFETIQKVDPYTKPHQF